MKPDPDPSTAPPSQAESALQSALQHPTERVPVKDERHERLRKAVRLQTATHDLGQFLVRDVFMAMGKVLHVLWNLVTVHGHRSDQENNRPSNDHDKRH